jgi:positive regulator of sigma E activity
MLKKLTVEISNKRFLTYAALLYILALTMSVWVPASSPIFENALYLKLALIPIAQAFLLAGARHRWPASFPIIVAMSVAFYLAMIISTISKGLF